MKSVTLIGMPGSGKSTIGELLANKLIWNFIDLDILIKEKEGRSHKKIIKVDGEKNFLKLEEKYALNLNLDKTIFSPGGSIIYSLPAMEKLQRETRIIYLTLPLEEIKKRLGRGIATRGIIGLKERGLTKLFDERDILYKNFSNQTINCSGLPKKAIIDEILRHQ